MHITIKVSEEELEEMEFDEFELAAHVMETLDGDTKEMSGYNILIKVNN